MSKRTYLPEIKRIIKVNDNISVKLLNGDSTYSVSCGALATPKIGRASCRERV